jgi:hypothetical protein
LNPSVLSVGKIAWRHHSVAYFQTNCICRRWSRRYIPTEYFRRYLPTTLPTELFRRYIPTDFETELFPSVLITDGICPSVIPLLFSGFLVVITRRFAGRMSCSGAEMVDEWLLIWTRTTKCKKL